MYIHKQVSLLNTAMFNVDGSERQWEDVMLESFDDIVNYWQRLKEICLNTSSGGFWLKYIFIVITY